MKKRLFTLLLAALMLFSILAACAPTEADTPPVETESADPVEPDPVEPDDPEEPEPVEPDDPEEPEPVDPDGLGGLPRDETLYFMGFVWSPANGWNPVSNAMNNPLVHEEVARGARLTMFETPYMFNVLDGSMTPLLADGPFRWNDDFTRLEYDINPNAHWSDGSPVTANDAVFTFHGRAEVDPGYAMAVFIDRVEAVDDSTVAIYSALNAAGLPVNHLMVETFLIQNYILQEAWMTELFDRNGNNWDDINQDPAEDVVWSGPYGPHFFNDEIVAIIRDDNYWGQHASMWGQLPVPRFLAHPIFADNPAGEAAFRDGLVDVSQMFIPNVHHLWEQDRLPIATYMDVQPFGICLSLPTAFFNMHSDAPGIDNADVRRAIAMAVNYDLIIANAMTNQSPSFAQVPRSLMNPTDGEQALFDSAAVQELQWDAVNPDVADRIEIANEILDGIFPDMDDAGFRTYNGERISYVASVPYGWTDWEAAMEIVAAAGADIGIEIVTQFDEWGVYQTIVTAAQHTEYDIFMMWTDDSSPAQPWGRIYNLLSSDHVGIDGNWAGNWGAWSNAEVDELLAAIPFETNQAEVVRMYTRLVEIYLTEVPSFTLMYRPAQFHAVNESVWTGFTEAGDGRNVPPLNAVNGYAIADLFNISLVG